MLAGDGGQSFGIWGSSVGVQLPYQIVKLKKKGI